ncbi:MAG: hypothetical protein AB8B56_07765, partial [Crocinitomicaceae bacterium]
MKKVALLLAICASFNSYAQENDSLNLPTRAVIEEAVRLWQQSFEQLKNDGLISYETTASARFSRNKLDSLFNCEQFGNEIGRVIV